MDCLGVAGECTPPKNILHIPKKCFPSHLEKFAPPPQKKAHWDNWHSDSSVVEVKVLNQVRLKISKCTGGFALVTVTPAAACLVALHALPLPPPPLNSCPPPKGKSENPSMIVTLYILCCIYTHYLQCSMLLQATFIKTIHKWHASCINLIVATH
jgi:hypothetical protein